MIRFILNINGQTIEADYDALADVSHDDVVSLLELADRVGGHFARETPASEENKQKEEPASSAQKKFLRDLGISFPDDITKMEAKKLLSEKLDK